MLRDGWPLTRPTQYNVGPVPVGGHSTFKAVTPWIKLFPGASNVGQSVQLLLSLQAVIDRWMYGTAQVLIDNMPLSGPMPVTVYLDIDEHWPTPGWSSITHLPVISDRDYFAGVHTLMLRMFKGPVVMSS